MGQYIHFVGKYINFVGIYINFVGEYINVVGKYLNFVGKYIYFVGKDINFVGKYINFVELGARKDTKCPETRRTKTKKIKFPILGFLYHTKGTTKIILLRPRSK